MVYAIRAVTSEIIKRIETRAGADAMVCLFTSET
jgi:hypothetical protein